MKKLTLAMLMGLSLSAFAQNKIETVDQCVGTVELTDAVDYTITGTDPFATSSTIDIKNPDAAVVFQNIRPSVVINKYLKYVTVNGVALTDNGNCRVSVYRHGAIVLPHSDEVNPDGSTFYPFTMYSEGGFKGDSVKYNGGNRVTKSTGSFPMKSFKIKRGYMVTMANNIDGTGYSHCFIANTADKEVDLTEIKNGKYLADKVSFFRIFRWQWPGKLGMSDARDNSLIELTNASWFYDWGAGNSTRTNAEYVPQRHHESGQSNGQGYKGAWSSFGTINGLHNLNTHILGQNEPDNTSGSGEVYTYITSIPSNPREKHGDYPLVQVAKDFLYSGMRIGTFACCNPSTGWVGEYVDWCRAHNIRVDFVATHYYIGGSSPQGCIDRLKSLYDRTGLPVWATEWNNGANWTTEGGFNTDAGWYSWGGGQDQKKNGEWLRDVLKRADGYNCIERLAVYNAVEGKREIWTNGQPTEAAKVLSTYQSGFAYVDANEYWMPWNFMAPENLVVEFNKSNKHAVLKWDHNNSKQTDSICIQRMIEDEGKVWVTIKNMGMVSKSSLTLDYDDLSSCSGVVKYRIADYDMDGKIRYSNEESLTIGSAMGNDKFQYGKITLTGTDVVQVDFSSAFEEVKPNVFMGPMTNNNSKLFPANFLYAYKEKFNYVVLPWQNQSGADTGLSKTEQIPFMAMHEGSGKFGDMAYEVGLCKPKQDTLDVVFNEPFAEGVTPIVITELQYGSKPGTTDKPITSRVWDVTNKGFKIINMREEAAGKLPAGKSTSYLAVAPGKGQVMSSVDKSELVKSDTLKTEQFRTETETMYVDSIVYTLKNTYKNKVGNVMMTANIGDVTYGTSYRAINFFDEKGDSLMFNNPLVFGGLQTLNYHSATILRRQSDVTITDKESEYYKWATGTRIKRQLDGTSTTTDKNDKTSGDVFGWIVLTNETSYEEEVKEETSYVIIQTEKSGETAIKTYTVTNSSTKTIAPKVVGRVIKLSGVENFEVYTMTGAKVDANAVQNPGVYVVKAGNQSVKVMVK